MKVFKDKTILKILDYYKNLWALSYTSAVSHWDLETYMPSKGASARGEALGRISVIRQKMFLDPAFVSLLHKAQSLKQLNDYENGVLRILNKSLKFYKKLPSEFIENFEKLTNTATVVWREAKQKENFKIFEPYLTKIFQENRKMADYLGYTNSPYDALLDLFEEGLTSDYVSEYFDQIRNPLKLLLEKITSSKNYFKVHELEKTKYNKDKMIGLNNKVLEYLWGDLPAGRQVWDRFRLDVSSHPFTTSFSNNDTRITTWYHEVDFARSLLAVIHEFGHALYELQSADELEMTPVAGGSSLVIHESQSRYWENHIGRSKEFIEKFKKDFDSVIGKSSTIENYYKYFNKVRPSLLRVEADEVTYHFHIMLRAEIEKGLIEAKLKVKDIPEIWKTKMKEYLGVVPKKPSEGAMQDIHWSGGSVGYFPTYSLGTSLSINWVGKEKIWLKNNIHKYGSTYTLQDLLKKLNKKFNPKVNIDYLTSKYQSIYKFK